MYILLHEIHSKMSPNKLPCLLTSLRIDALAKAITELELSVEQKANMSSFLEEKREIIRHGELKEAHFQRLAELGYGNGGVVLKVEHKPSGIIMARKVCAVLYMCMCVPSYTRKRPGE